MNTRHASPGSPLRQERWASARVEGRGLLGNLVATRLAGEDDQSVRELVWGIQRKSWQPGGMEGLARDLISTAPQGLEAGPAPYLRDPRLEEFYGYEEQLTSEPRTAMELAPADVVADLQRFCLDGGGPGLGSLVRPLTELMEADSARALASIADTTTTREMRTALARCAAQGSTILVEGPARIGKTTAARAWCDASRGLARYIPTPHGNDMDPLFRAIAGGIGTAAGLTFKARQVEERILRTLPGSGLTLVFDDAWNLWPQGDTRQSHPRRLQWLLGLLDAGVGVALVTAPQWWNCRRAYIAQTGWAVDQLDGRIADTVTLSAELTREDCMAVARIMVPAAGPEIWETLGDIAGFSSRRLGALDSAVREAVHQAQIAGRSVPMEQDLREAARVALRTEQRFAEETRPEGRRAPKRPESLPPGSVPRLREQPGPGPLQASRRGSADALPAPRQPAALAMAGALDGDEDFAVIGNGGSDLAPPDRE